MVNWNLNLPFLFCNLFHSCNLNSNMVDQILLTTLHIHRQDCLLQLYSAECHTETFKDQDYTD